MTASGAGPAKDPARIRAMFDQIAPRYDLLNHLLSLGRDIAWRRRAARRVAALAPPGPVLDAATGTGDLLLALDRALPVGVPAPCCCGPTPADSPSPTPRWPR